MNDTEPLYFLSFCIEAYKKKNNMTGEEVMKLFDKTGVSQYLINGYDVFHTQGEQWLMEEIEDYLKHHT